MTISNLTKMAASKRVENIVEKGEIARYEQFLLFPQCFHEACFPGASKGVIVWEWVKMLDATQWSFCGKCGLRWDHTKHAV